jgi:BRCT domain type II-containing protein
MSENITTPAQQSEQSDAAHVTPASLAGITRTPAKRTSKPAQRKSATSRKQPAQSKPAKRTSKPAQRDESARTESARKADLFSALILMHAELITNDAAYRAFVLKAKRAGIDISDVTRDDAREMMRARLSYAPGDGWDNRLGAPTKLRAGKRSNVAAVPAQRRVTRKPAGKPAQRKPAQRKSA